MPIDLHGKTYWTVAERLKLANKEVEPPVGVQAVETEVIQVGVLTVVRATVVFADSRRFTGTAAVNPDSRQRAEQDAPVETAETSAVGRALAFAGYYGSPEGIAGAEEILIAQSRQQTQQTAQGARSAPPPGRDDGHGTPSFPSGDSRPRPVQTTGAQVTLSGATPAQARFLRQLWERAGREGVAPDAEQMNRQMASRLIDDLVKEAEARGK